MSDPLQLRLRSAREAIRDATREALKAAESEETLPGVTVGGGGGFHLPSATTPHPSRTDRYSAEERVESSQANAAAADAENDDPNAGRGRGDRDEEASRTAFELGMSLFGDDVGAIERDVAERLGRVEDELRDIVREGARRPYGAAAAAAADGGPPGVRRAAEEDLEGVDEEEVEREAQGLAAKAAFLRRCSEARAALDEAETLALSSAGSSSGGGGTLVETSRLLSEADRALWEADDGLAAASKSGGQRTSDVDVARRIVDSICAHVRRKRVDLQVRAAAALDACIAITAESITVGGAAGGKRGGDGLADAYDALALLSSAENEAQASANEKLDDAMLVISDDLYRLTLKPMLVAYKESIKKGSAPPAIDFRETSSPGAGGAVGPAWPGVSGALSPAGGPAHMLEWTSRAPPRNPKSGDSSSVVDAKHSLSAQETIAAWGNVLGSIRTVLAFVHERVLLGRTELCEMVGRCLLGEVLQDQAEDTAVASGLGLAGASLSLKGNRFGRLMDDMVESLWETCLPSEASEEVLSELHVMGQKVREFASAFERDMVERGLLHLPVGAGASQGKKSPLGEFAADFERRYAEKRRTIILARGRDLLLKGDYHNTIEVGKDVYAGRMPVSDSPLDFDEKDDGMEVFELHKCAISRVASDLMELVRTTMDSAVDPRYFKARALAPLPPTLYRTSRELFDLFRAVIPSIHGNEVSTIPRIAAVLHNDCVFFAHELLTFGLEYRDRFPDYKDPESSAGEGSNAAALRQLCTFVDLVPPFRELADRTMVDTIERQKRQLADIVGERISILRDALRSNEGVVEWTDAETALTAGAYHLRHLSNAWGPILSRDVYGRAVGNLVDTLFSLYLNQVMAARDISESASHFVSALFRDAGQKMSDLFSAGTSSPEEAVRIAWKFCSLWDKFEAVGKFMDMSLLDISNALSAGVFRSVTGPELTRLIKAAFDDSERRKELIKVLAPDARKG